MSKHTTAPKIKMRGTSVNSHVLNLQAYPIGNWNRHKKRRIPSRIRTPGRMLRSLTRLTKATVVNYFTVKEKYRAHVDHVEAVLSGPMPRDQIVASYGLLMVATGGDLSGIKV